MLWIVYYSITVYRTPRFTHISPVLKSLHWLKIDQRIHFKILAITYKTLYSRNPSYLHNLLQVQLDPEINRFGRSSRSIRPQVESSSEDRSKPSRSIESIAKQ